MQLDSGNFKAHNTVLSFRFCLRWLSWLMNYELNTLCMKIWPEWMFVVVVTCAWSCVECRRWTAVLWPVPCWVYSERTRRPERSSSPWQKVQSDHTYLRQLRVPTVKKVNDYSLHLKPSMVLRESHWARPLDLSTSYWDTTISPRAETHCLHILKYKMWILKDQCSYMKYFFWEKDLPLNHSHGCLKTDRIIMYESCLLSYCLTITKLTYCMC